VTYESIISLPRVHYFTLEQIIPPPPPPPVKYVVQTEHEVVHKPGQLREFSHIYDPPKPQVAPPVRAAPPTPPPPEPEKKGGFPWWLFLLPLLCLPLLCCCCPKKKKEVIPPPFKAPIDLENPAKDPVRPVRAQDDRMIDEEIKRELAVVQRTVVQQVQIPVEEYEALYGSKKSQSKTQALSDEFRPIHTDHAVAASRRSRRYDTTDRMINESARDTGTRVVGDRLSRRERSYAPDSGAFDSGPAISRAAPGM